MQEYFAYSSTTAAVLYLEEIEKNLFLKLTIPDVPPLSVHYLYIAYLMMRCIRP